MRTNYMTPWSSGAALIVIFTTLGTLVLGGIIVNAVYPHNPRPNPRIVAEQQRSMDVRTDRQRQFANEIARAKAEAKLARQARHERNLAYNRALCARYPNDFYLNADGECELWPTAQPTITITVQ